MPELLRDKYQYFTQASIEKLKATGHNGPKFSLEQAVADYVQNYLVPHRHLELKRSPPRDDLRTFRTGLYREANGWILRLSRRDPRMCETIH